MQEESLKTKKTKAHGIGEIHTELFKSISVNAKRGFPNYYWRGKKVLTFCIEVSKDNPLS